MTTDKYGRRITYSPDETAIILDISCKKVFELMRQGKLKFFMAGQNIRITLFEVQHYLMEYDDNAESIQS